MAAQLSLTSPSPSPPQTRQQRWTLGLAVFQPVALDFSRSPRPITAPPPALPDRSVPGTPGLRTHPGPVRTRTVGATLLVGASCLNRSPACELGSGVRGSAGLGLEVLTIRFALLLSPTALPHLSAARRFWFWLFHTLANWVSSCLPTRDSSQWQLWRVAVIVLTLTPPGP